LRGFSKPTDDAIVVEPMYHRNLRCLPQRPKRAMAERCRLLAPTPDRAAIVTPMAAAPKCLR
jgi:hypothetical protein